MAYNKDKRVNGEYDPPLPERLTTLTEKDKAELERLLNKYKK